MAAASQSNILAGARKPQGLARNAASMSLDCISAQLDNASIEGYDWVEHLNRNTLGESKFCFYKRHAIAEQLKDDNAELLRQINRVDLISEKLSGYAEKAQRMGLIL